MVTLSSLCAHGTKDASGLTCFNDFAPRLDVQPRCDKGDVCEVEDLGPVREGERPEFWCGPQDVDEALSIAGADLGAIRHAYQICVAVYPKATVEFLSRGDEQGLEDVSCLIFT